MNCCNKEFSIEVVTPGCDPICVPDTGVAVPTLWICPPTQRRIVCYSAFVNSLVVCPDCFDAAGEEIWDGTFPNIWTPTADFIEWSCSYDTFGRVDVQGKRLSINLDLKLADIDGPNRWFLYAFCDLPSPPAPLGAQKTVWSGLKLVGEDSTGIYMRNDGCSVGPACVAIESY